MTVPAVAPAPCRSLCPYCGVGCGLEVVVRGEKRQVRGDRAHPSSQGMVCVKGATILDSLDRDRLTQPLLRERLDQPFRPVDWDTALDRVVAEIQRVGQTLGPQGICMYGSGQLQTEDYYVAQKFLKGCLGTNNFDSNSRLCMSSAVSAYNLSFGSDGPPCTYGDLELTDCAVIVGSNAAECHPIAFNRFQKYRKQTPGVKLIVVDPRQTATATGADLHLAITPGSDIDLFHSWAYLWLQWGTVDREFIDRHTQGFQDYAALVADYSPEQVAPRCGVSVAEIEQGARLWAESQRVLSLWSMGINQSSQGTAKARSLINLHLLTGQLGRPGAGPFSLTGQPNAMGGREAGGLSKLLPGYRSVTNPAHRATVEAFWGVPSGRIPAEPGRSAWEIITGLEQDQVGLLWIVATNPAVSLPDLNRVKAALARSPFTILQDAYHPTETTALAHLLLPAAQWGEKTGTMTNSERVVTLCPAWRSPPGQARADWEIFAAVGQRLGFGAWLTWDSAAAVFEEYVQLTAGRVCDQSGLSHALLGQGPQQWPAPAQGTVPLGPDGGKRLYGDRQFPTPDGRARFGLYHAKGMAEPPDPAYPYVLTVGRLYGHWHTQTRTGRIAKIQAMYPEPWIEIHPKDGACLGITEGQRVQVRSRRGQGVFPAKITRAIAPGTVFVPMHWGSLWATDTEANALTHPIACSESLQPELKACAVALFPLPPLSPSLPIEGGHEEGTDQGCPAVVQL